MKTPGDCCWRVSMHCAFWTGQACLALSLPSIRYSLPEQVILTAFYMPVWVRVKFVHVPGIIIDGGCHSAFLQTLPVFLQSCGVCTCELSLPNGTRFNSPNTLQTFPCIHIPVVIGHSQHAAFLV